MSLRLIGSLSTTDALDEAFSDGAVLSAMLQFEVALARAEAAAGIIPHGTAEALSAVRAQDFDAVALAREARASGTVVVPFVRALTDRVAATDAESASYVHWGATSQDVWDTAMVLCLARAFDTIEADHRTLAACLADLAERHGHTVQLGRTLLQPATPVTFGLKAAGWLGSITRCWSRIVVARDEARVLQFGGAAGTLAALGDRAPMVEQSLAAALDLAVPEAPWHAHRDRLGAVAVTCGLYVSALGKMARDISLLMQHEVAEAAEPGGGSSTMPHKRNPSGAAAVLAAAARVPGLVGTLLGAAVQEHERAVGGWHAEGPTIADLVATTGSALDAAVVMTAGLEVDDARMRQNLEGTRGVIFAERAMLSAGRRIGRRAAAKLVEAAVRTSLETGTPLSAVIASMPELRDALDDGLLADLANPDAYLGSADRFRRQLLAAARRVPYA